MHEKDREIEKTGRVFQSIWNQADSIQQEQQELKL